MNKKFIKVLCSLVIISLLNTSTIAMAKIPTDSKSSKMSVYFNSFNKLDNKIVITDAELIEEIVKQDNIKLSPGEKVTKIEYELFTEFTAKETADSLEVVSVEDPYWPWEYYKISNVVSYPGEWYNPDTDIVFSAIIDGPDTFVYGQSVKYKSYHTASFILTGDVEITTGWEMGKEYTYYWSSNTPVEKGQRLYLDVIRLYYKKSFDVLRWDDRVKVWVYFDTCWAYKPSSIWVRKVFTEL